MRTLTPLTRALAPLVALALVVGCRTASDLRLVADAHTTVRVKTALINHPDLGVRSIDVRVTRGVVELSGRVLTQAEADTAVRLARLVPDVVDVRSRLQVGGQPAPPEEGLVGPPPPLPEFDALELQDSPGVLAFGGSLGLSLPHATGLTTEAALSPLVRIGPRRGLGWAVGFDWFRVGLQSLGGHPGVLTRVQIKPVMVGLGYTIASDRISVSPSILGGYAWNSLTITDTGTALGLPVEVENSWAWRPGLSLWYDVNRRVLFNLSIGHVITGLQLTVVEGGRLEKRSVRGDTTTVHAGIAYKLF